MPLFLRFFHSVRPAMMPDRIVCNSPNRRWAFEGGAHGEGLNNSQYSRMCAASTPSVLLRPNLVRAKSRICQSAPKFDPSLEWAPRGGRDQATGLTVCRVCCFSNCIGLI